MNDEFWSLVPRPWRRRRRVARGQQARPDAAEPTSPGRRVRFDRGIHVPEDEVGFFVVEAIPSGEE